MVSFKYACNKKLMLLKQEGFTKEYFFSTVVPQTWDHPATSKVKDFPEYQLLSLQNFMAMAWIETLKYVFYKRKVKDFNFSSEPCRPWWPKLQRPFNNNIYLHFWGENRSFLFLLSAKIRNHWEHTWIRVPSESPTTASTVVFQLTKSKINLYT